MRTWGCVWAGAPVGAESENMGGGGVWAGASVGAECEKMRHYLILADALTRAGKST